MEGPKAPKDPTAKGSSFYICRQKDIAGNPTPDGRGIQFIYLNDVRLITFAQMVGNITDEDMLEHLKTAQGFLSMVAGIGVSVLADDQNQTVAQAHLPVHRQRHGRGLRHRRQACLLGQPLRIQASGTRVQQLLPGQDF